MFKRGTRVAAAVCLVFASCSHLSKRPYLHTQEDVGTVQVGVQSVAPFEDYISSLEPQFDLKPQDALTNAIAQSQVEDSALVNQFLATLQIALPQIARAKTPTLDANKQPTGSEVETHTTTPPTEPTTTAPSTLTPTATVTIPTTATVEVDSALRYRAATALAQEVSLLNHYVRDAAVRTGTKPYIVRLLVTVMPGARNQAYDAYTTISFFTATKQAAPVHSSLYDQVVFEDVIVIGADGKPQRQAVAHVGQITEQLIQKRGETKKTGQPAEAGDTSQPVNVIPLLVTDELEANLHTNALERIRDISLALQGTLSNIGIGVGTRSHNEDLDKTLSKNLNSIFALGQPAPNAVVARLGAVYANGDFVTVPRSYSVTLLVLVKTLAGEQADAAQKQQDESGESAKGNDGAKGTANTPPPTSVNAKDGVENAADDVILNPSINFIATTQFHDAHSSDFKPPRTRDESKMELVSLLEARGKTPTDTEVTALLDAAQSGDFEKARAVPYASNVWSDAVWVSQRSGRSAGTFVVAIPHVSLPTNVDHFSLLDDGTSMTLAINHGANLLPDRLHANVAAQFGTNDWVFLSNTDVKVGPYGRTAVFTFPSLGSITDVRADNAAKEAKAAKDGAAAENTGNGAKKEPKKTSKHHIGNSQAASLGTAQTAGPSTKPAASVKPRHVYAEVVYGRSLTSWTAAGTGKQPELLWYPTATADSGALSDTDECGSVGPSVRRVVRLRG
jgi:hypothetical protein